MRKALVILALLLVASFAFCADVDTYCYSCLSATEQMAYLAIQD